MSEFGINLGLAWQRPFESDFAMVRRFLIANPAQTWRQLRQALRQRVDKPGSSVDAIDILRNQHVRQQCGTSIDTKVAYRRQCPECAASLYHSPFFALPWLSLCPLHWRPLTTTCPECRQPWPSTDELPYRECALCGLPSSGQLAKRVIVFPLPSSYQLFQELEQLARREQRHGYLLGAFEGSAAWQCCEMMSPSYPAYLSSSWRPELRRWRNHVQIPSGKVFHRSDRLQPAQSLLDFVYLAENRLWLNGTQRVVLNKIIRLANVSLNHHLHIANYHHLDLAALIDGPPPCPLCMAISLWFMNCQSLPYHWTHYRDVDQYPFCLQTGVEGFYKPAPQTTLFDGDDFFGTDMKFQKWSYRRDLEQSFMLMLEICTNLFRARRELHDDSLTKTITLNRDLGMTRYFDQYFYREGDHFHLLYRERSPLARIPELLPKGLRRVCSSYREYAREHAQQFYNFHQPLMDGALSATQYGQLARSFMQYLLGTEYTRYVENINLLTNAYQYLNTTLDRNTGGLTSLTRW